LLHLVREEGGMSFKLERISATNLGAMSAEDFCPRCFWLKARLNFKSPWSLFPRIFNDLDGHQKAFTELYLRDMKVLPPWLAEFEVTEVIPVPGYGKFFARHPLGIDISGVTDHMFRMVSGKNLVLDYKTSRPGSDKMFPIYKTQLSVYSWISPRFALGEVGQLALVYYEPMTLLNDWRDGATPGVTAPAEGLRLNFRPYIMKIDAIDIDPLVARAKEIAEGDMPAPYGRDAYTCTECQRILDWMAGVGGAQKDA